MYYDDGGKNAQNRKNSGCDAGKSVCNFMPFSQKLNDPQTLANPSCDEWPMAEVNNDENEKPNVLRCINQPENSCKEAHLLPFPSARFANSKAAGGAQLKNFEQGVGDQPDRKGDGDFVDGDYWLVAFDNPDKE